MVYRDGVYNFLGLHLVKPISRHAGALYCFYLFCKLTPPLYWARLTQTSIIDREHNYCEIPSSKYYFRISDLLSLVLHLNTQPQYSQLLTSYVLSFSLIPLAFLLMEFRMARCAHSTMTSRVLLHIRAHTSTADPVFREDFDNELASLNLGSQLESKPIPISN